MDPPISSSNKLSFPKILDSKVDKPIIYEEWHTIIYQFPKHEQAISIEAKQALFKRCVSHLEEGMQGETKEKFFQLAKKIEFQDFFRRVILSDVTNAPPPSYENMLKVSCFFLKIQSHVPFKEVDRNAFVCSAQFMLSEYKISKENENKLGKLIDLPGNSGKCSEYVINFFKHYKSTLPPTLFLSKIEKQLKWLELGLNFTKKIHDSKLEWERSSPREPVQLPPGIVKQMVEKSHKENIIKCTAKQNEISNRAYSQFKDDLIKIMSAEDAIAFFGGYHGPNKEAGHAVLFEIEKQPNNQFCLRIINTGEDAPPSFFRTEIRNVILYEDLPMDLIAGNFVEIFYNFKNKKIAELYTMLKKYEKGDSYETKQQTHGTCSMSPIWGWIEYHLFKDDHFYDRILETNLDLKSYINFKNDFLLKNIESLTIINNQFIKNKFDNPMGQYQLGNGFDEFNQANLEKLIALGLDLYQKSTGKHLKGIKFEFE